MLQKYEVGYEELTRIIKRIFGIFLAQDTNRPSDTGSFPLSVPRKQPSITGSELTIWYPLPFTIDPHIKPTLLNSSSWFGQAPKSPLFVIFMICMIKLTITRFVDWERLIKLGWVLISVRNDAVVNNNRERYFRSIDDCSSPFSSKQS